MNLTRLFRSIGRATRAGFDIAAATQTEGSDEQQALWSLGAGAEGLLLLVLEFIDGDGQLPTPEQWRAAFGPFDRARKLLRKPKPSPLVTEIREP